MILQRPRKYQLARVATLWYCKLSANFVMIGAMRFTMHQQSSSFSSSIYLREIVLMLLKYQWYDYVVWSHEKILQQTCNHCVSSSWKALVSPYPCCVQKQMYHEMFPLSLSALSTGGMSSSQNLRHDKTYVCTICKVKRKVL